jgi:hypothetical protein
MFDPLRVLGCKVLLFLDIISKIRKLQIGNKVELLSSSFLLGF